MQKSYKQNGVNLNLNWIRWSVDDLWYSMNQEATKFRVKMYEAVTVISQIGNGWISFQAMLVSLAGQFITP